MKSVKTLIDMATVKAGTDAALCRALSLPGHHPYEWRAGKRALSPEATILLCDYLALSGEETREWVAVAIIENPKNSSRAELLRRALFACWGLGVGFLLTTPSDASAEIQQKINQSATALPSADYKFHTNAIHIVA